MRRLHVVLLLSLVVLEPAGARAAVPAGQVGVRLLEAPVDRAADPRAAGAIIDHLTPGRIITRRIEVSSGLDRPVHVSLYAAGATVNHGAFRFLDGRTGNDLATWTSVAPEAVDVAPRSTAMAVVTVAVPRDAKAGEWYAVVWAELPPTQSGGVAVVNRVGIRLYLSVGAGAEPATDFVIESLTAGRSKNGRPSVTAAVRNTGGRALDLGGVLRLGDGPGGLAAGPFSVQPGMTLGIGERGDVVTLLDPAIPIGPWTAGMTLRSGLVERAASARIQFPLAAGSFSSPVNARPARSRLPLAAASTLAALVAFLIFVVLRRRREERREEQASGPTSPPGRVVPLPARPGRPLPGSNAAPYGRQAVASREHLRTKTGSAQTRRSAHRRSGTGL